jgi:hypothetical protein
LHIKPLRTTVIKWVMLAATLLCGLVAGAQAVLDEYGALLGTVTLPSGAPAQGVPVTATVGRATFTWLSDADGGFSGILPAGAVTLTAPTITPATVPVSGGQTTHAALILPSPGVIVVLGYPDGTVPTADCRAAWGTAGTPARAPVEGIPLSRKAWWIPNVPATAGWLDVVAEDLAARGQPTVHTRFTFATPMAMRTVEMILPRPAPATTRVTGPDGTPLVDTPALVTITTQGNAPLPGGPDPPAHDITDTVLMTTDGDGCLALGLFAPGDTRVEVRTPGRCGVPLSFVPVGDGAPLAFTCLLAEPTGSLTQVVYDARGRPAPHTDVCAAFCWFGQVTLLRAHTDADGKVIWRNLPPAPLLVWGDGVPLGRIDPGRAAMQPLPAVSPGTPTRVRLLADGADAATAVAWMIRRGPQMATATDAVETLVHTGVPVATTVAAMPAQSPLGVGAVTQPAPSRAAFWDVIYVPQNDLPDAEEITVHLPLLDTPRAVLSLTPGPNGPTLPRTLTVTPHDTDRMPQLLTPETARRLGFFTPALLPDGTREWYVPVPGDYTVAADLGGDAQSRLTLNAGRNACTLTFQTVLPQVPAGVEVFGILARDPGRVVHLPAGAEGTIAPIYGGHAGVLAAWYTPSTDRRVLWDWLAAEEPARTLTLRDVIVHAPADATPLQWLPDLPGTATRAPIPFDPTHAAHLRLFPGDQALLTAAPLRYRWFTVPVQGTEPIATVSLPPLPPALPVAAPVGPPLGTTTVLGSLLNEDGRPFARRQPLLVRGTCAPQRSALTTATDDDGIFRVAGVPSGPLMCWNPSDTRSTAWLVDPATTDVTNLSLHRTDQATQIAWGDGQAPLQGWWLPDTGAPVLLGEQSTACIEGLQDGPGWLWAISPSSGAGRSQRLTLMPGTHALSPWADGPSLGLLLQLNDGDPACPTLTLTGAPWGARKGLSVTFTGLTWQPYPALGIVGATVYGVPPGDYLATLDDGRSAVAVISEDGGSAWFP